MRRWALLAAVLSGLTPGPAATGDAPRHERPASHLPTRANAEMARDILDLAFALESGRAMPGLGRFEGPVTVAARGPTPATLVPDLSLLLGRLRDEAGLDVALGPLEGAGIVVEVVPAAALAEAAPGAACFAAPGVSSWDGFLAARGTPLLDWAAPGPRTRAAVFLPREASPQEIRDCLHEEVAQALGPLNDLDRLTDSAFDDDNRHGALTAFDMLALRAINDPALSTGMTREEVAARLPAILARLNPAGEDAPDGSDARAGEALMAQARALAARDPAAARATFQEAEALLADAPGAQAQRAHARLQLAGFALSEGFAPEVLRLTALAMPEARALEDARLLSTLMLLRAQALEAEGCATEAEALRLDALARARYGFGDEGAALARLAQVQALDPWRAARLQGS